MDLGLPVLDRELLDRGENPHAGIVHQNVDVAKSIRRLLDKATAVFGTRHVGGDTDHTSEKGVIQVRCHLLDVG